MNLRIICLLTTFLYGFNASAQIVLLGDNAPFVNVNDGDFCAEWGSWRQAKQSPFWKTYALEGENQQKMGLDFGRLFSMHKIGVAESKILNTNPDYQQPKAGDVFIWNFDADLEYISDGTISFSLVFGNRERMLAEKVKLIGSDKTVEHFMILSEPGFDAQKDVNLGSLRFGSSDEVDYGRGCKAVKSKKQGKDLIVEFDGEGSGVSPDDFAGKLLGKTTDGKLIIGYVKL